MSRAPAACLIAGILSVMLIVGCASSAKDHEQPLPQTGPPQTGPPQTAGASEPGTADDAHGNSCSAPPSSPRGSCGGCSVNCGSKEALCVAGEEWPSGGASCQKTAVCTCR